MATLPGKNDTISPDMVSEPKPKVLDPTQEPPPSTKDDEDCQAGGKEVQISAGVCDSISNTTLFKAAQALEQEAKKLQGLFPDSFTETIDRRLNVAIGLLEEVYKELNKKNTTKSREGANDSTKDDADEESEDQQDGMICKVKQASMEDWTQPRLEPKHVIVAYYPSTSLIDIRHDGKAVGKDILCLLDELK
ncbi:hypothetical protein ACHAPO_010903 [Fusarium lateritium]